MTRRLCGLDYKKLTRETRPIRGDGRTPYMTPYIA